MNKTAIKNYAVWARNKLIADIEYKAGLMGITENGIAAALPQSTGEVQFFDIGTKDYASIRGREINQRNAFVSAIRAKEKDNDYKKAFHFVVEKVAYTWFNRLVAIRFMEVNDYLPSRVRVLSSENENKAEPDMVTRPFDTDMSFSQQEEDLIIKLKDENRLDELFRWLFIKQCHKLYDVLPQLFSPETLSSNQNDYMELLLTISFTDKDGVLWHLVHDIREQDFRIRTPEDDERQRIENIAEEDMPAGQVEIIGWMYQYYNTEPKDQVFADLKKNIKINKDKIPAATQLFTPDWIVRYMVENSLGRLWVEGHPNEELKKNWKYYLEEAEQEPEVQKQLAEIQKEYANLRPEEIKVIDPCMGSGHILVYLFEVLMQIYESQGWTQREAAQSIVQNNLYGLDIDERASQLAYFAVMMKARQYDRRFLERKIEPHVYEIQESNLIDSNVIDYFANGNKQLKKGLTTLVRELHDAKEYGSLLKISMVDFPGLYERINEMREETHIFTMLVMEELLPLIKRAETMAQKYDVVCTNPPYMGMGGMSPRLSKYVKDNYPNSKGDLFAVFIEYCIFETRKNGYLAMITQHAWMFLSSYEKMRKDILKNNVITMAHLGLGTFEDLNSKVVQSTAFVICHGFVDGYISNFHRLFEKQGVYEDNQAKAKWLITGKHRFDVDTSVFYNISGSPFAYWVSKNVFYAFLTSSMNEVSVAKCGMGTSDNGRFLRLWFEPSFGNIGFSYHNISETTDCRFRWIPYDKGGDYRKWYGNKNYVVNFYNNAEEIREATKDASGGRVVGTDYYFKKHLSWSSVTSSSIAFRFFDEGFIFDSATNAVFFNDEKDLLNALGYLNCKFINDWANIINPTINFTVSDFLKLPTARKDQKEVVESLVTENIRISQEDWDSFETSWDFERHPLVKIRRNGVLGETSSVDLAECYALWEQECEKRFNTLKSNEERLNSIFINIYGLQNEITEKVEDKDITVHRADLQREVKSLLSYAVGCMFGRYSLDYDGLAFAGGVWDVGRYNSFIPDQDNCIPITDESYFEDDIVGRFIEFIRVIYGVETLEVNLSFIANALGNKGNSSREVIRNYFLNDFYKDHCSTYSVTGSGKRPIYWLFDSGKQNGFKALVYMHRWNADTVGNLRVEYLHRIQRVYEKEIMRMQDIIDNSRDSREIGQASKHREKLVKQLKEARDYDAKIAHVALSRVKIDLDDGIKANYEKVQKGSDGKSLGILAKV